MSSRRDAPEPGALIPLNGTLNLRDLGGWPTAGGTIAHGRLFRSDRLAGLTGDDHSRLDALGIATVIDLRYEQEVAEHPSLLWSSVVNHHNIPLGGALANQQSFIARALAGHFDGVSDDDVGQSYLDLLEIHATDFGRAIEALLEPSDPALFHCTAGKDRTGLLAMLILRAVGVADDDVLTDFELSNRYRARRRVAELRSVFADHGLDVELFRPALSAPRPAMERAMGWIDHEWGGTGRWISDAASVEEAEHRLTRRLVTQPR